MSVLAIDLGTGGPKVAVVAADGTVLGSASEPVATRFGPEGAVEQDAEEWWAATCRAARRAMHASAERPGAVEAVACDSQYFTNVAVDASGRPLAPARTWMDARGGEHARALWDDGGFDAFLTIHGMLPVGPGLGAVLALRAEHPDVYARAAAFVEPMDFINLRLTGRITATASSAMPFLVTDNRVLGACRYSPELLARAGLDEEKLPPLIPIDGMAGEVLPGAAAALGIAPGVPVIGGVSDSISGAVGSGALGPGDGTVVIGTTTVLACHHHERVSDLDRFLVTVPSVFADRWFVTAENGLGGRSLEWWLRGVLDVDDLARIDELVAGSPPGAGGVLFLPWLTGSLSPAPADDQRGAFLGLSLATDRADLSRAVLEGVALNLRWLQEQLVETLGTPFPRLRFAGGGALSAVWAQILADVTSTPIDVLESPRLVNARGAAWIAYERLGRIRFDDIPALLRTHAVYEPDGRLAAVYDERKRVLVDLHERLADPVRRLHRPPGSRE